MTALTFHRTLLAAALAASFPGWAQQAPDAGRVLQDQNAPRLQPPRPTEGVRIATPPAGTSTAPGGTQVVVPAVQFEGNSLYSDALLQTVVGDAVGKPLDLAALRGLADRVSDFYRAGGYPFARAYLPPQEIGKGALKIAIVEGRYGQVRALGDERLASQAQPFLAALRPGDVIGSAPLERATLILDDLPGVRIAPLVRPGQTTGSGDLEVRVERTAALRGELGYDNYGNRYTGEHRLRAQMYLDSPMLLGDQITLSAVVSDEALWLGSLGYHLPLGASGLRGQVSYAQTYYTLAKDFASLQASGTAQVSSLGLSYPLLRSQRANVTLAATLQHKDLLDRQGATATEDRKSSDSAVLSAQFDRRDGSSAITYGSVSYTTGTLMLGMGLEGADALSGRNARGAFGKWNLDVVRLQHLSTPGVSVFGHLAAQWAQKNLDSSEKFSLGGASGVRAYPVGEGSGDEGWLLQTEARYNIKAFSPYAFFDVGVVNANARPERMTPAVTDNRRTIAGAGLGLRYQQRSWSLDAAVAWPTTGGPVQSDVQTREPRVWLTAGYRF